MDSEQYRTPKKLFSRQSPALRFLGARTSSGILQANLKYSETTPNSISKKRPGSFNIFPIINTPPSRFPRVINPFEAALTERLHLPLICSPSLFQRPSTPQHSSTQFEWTIDDVSSLGPANVEPHETQFQATLDPDLEAKAQAAISSYFKEQQIVPSPVDCPLRNQKINLSEPLENASVIKTGRRIRDGISQTLLTFPPVLPTEIERLLKSFCTFHDNQQQTPTNDCDIMIDYEARDNSLRRKLFETTNNSEGAGDPEIKNLTKYDEFSPPPKTPDMETDPLITHNSRSSFSKSSFGSLSPISKLDSPKQLVPKNDNGGKKFESCLETSPYSSTNYQIKVEKALNLSTLPGATSHSSICISTPDELLIQKENTSPTNMSVDVNFSGRLGRLLVVNSLKKSTSNGVEKSKSFSEVDMLNNSYNNFEDDDMQVSQLSVKSTSSSNSSQHPDTPVRKRRSASRKNLSQSFSCHLSDEDNEKNNIQQIGDVKAPLQIKGTVSNRDILTNQNGETDSGFNDMTNTPDKVKFSELRANIINKENCLPIFPADVSMCEDVSMICCSTPSKTKRF